MAGGGDTRKERVAMQAPLARPHRSIPWQVVLPPRVTGSATRFRPLAAALETLTAP